MQFYDSKKTLQSIKNICCFVIWFSALLGIANELLETLHVGRRLKKLSDINSSFFVTLYEGLCAEPVKGLCVGYLSAVLT